MRPASELKLKNKDMLSKKLLAFVQNYPTMSIPSQRVLADTVIILHGLVEVSDKVLTLKSYYNMVQDMQRTTYLADSLAWETLNHLPRETDEEQAALQLQVDALRRDYQVQGAARLTEALASITMLDKTPQERTRQLLQDAKPFLCTDDVFMVACAYLGVEIGKHGSVFYLKGESPDFKETKRNRSPRNLRHEKVLRDLSESLYRLDQDRGKVEQSYIDGGFNHLVKRNDLRMKMRAAAAWIKQGKREGQQYSKTDVINAFNLSLTNYERMMSMARREGLLLMRAPRKDPTNAYTLSTKNHAQVIAFAEKFGHSPSKTLNKILDDHFDHLEFRRKKAEMTASVAPKSSSRQTGSTS